ncbi:MAG TPA: hypothetical protein VGX78_14605 [Pirellulales bacterium]|nr:hypothetical protein [Pirellulales bacterium]
MATTNHAVAAGPDAEGPQVIKGDVLRDLDFAFEIRLPSEDWEFSNENEVRQLNAAACAGMADLKNHCFLAILAERSPKTDLAAYAKLLLSAMPLKRGSDPEEQPLKLAGEPALKIKVSAVTQELVFRYLLYVVEHEGFVYQVLCWTLEAQFAKHEAQLARAAESLRFLPGQKPRERTAPAAGEPACGSDWRVDGRRYENGSFGFALDAPEGWRFWGAADLARRQPNAVVGLIGSNPNRYQIYLVERIGDGDRQKLTDWYREQFTRTLGPGAKAGESRSVKIVGVEGTETWYRNSREGGLTLDRVWTVLFHDHISVQVLTWWVDGQEQETTRDDLDATYAAMSLLTNDEIERLAAVLQREDPDNVVGATFSLRGGVHRDFEMGFSMSKPAGLWTAKAGDRARKHNAAARLVLTEPASGAVLIVLPELLPNLSHDDYHRLLLKQMQAAPDTQVGRRPLGDLELQVSRFDRQLSGLDLTYVLITAVRDRRHVQLLIYGLRSSLAGIDERLNDIVAGLKLSDRPETPRLDAADALTDVRLGFRLSAGNTGGRLKWMPQGQIDAVGSQALLQSGELSCLAQGICSVEAFAAGLAVKAILKELAGKGFDLTTRRDLDDVLDGLPAKQIFVEKRAAPRMLASIWIARRANTQYLFSATEPAPAGQGDALTMREHKKYFSLVD